MIKASARDTLKNLSEVNIEVLPLFSDTADALTKLYGNDTKKALEATLAYLSGHFKGVLECRSLLTGQEKCITMEYKTDKPFYAVSLVWTVLKKYLPLNITD